LQDYPNRDLASRVTIRELLNHTGGTGDIFTPEYEAHRKETRTRADYVKLFGSRPVAFDPGSRMEYSNYGFILLGRLIELVSGEPYQKYVQEHIYQPAGMMHTDSRPEVDHVNGRAIGYSPRQNGLVPNTEGMPWSGTSAGGGYSTVRDLFLFAEALRSGKLLDPALLREATQSSAMRPDYGMGFYVLANGGYGHGAVHPGSMVNCTSCPTAVMCWSLSPTGTREWPQTWPISLPQFCLSAISARRTNLHRLQEVRKR
jgi:D-alanyl-D-alanine carboxypeptidase